MSRLPLNTLTAFRTVGELQNLRAAADVLHLTHSAVSQQIRGLEEQLGFALFERRVLPSFAQRWLLPRMGRWRERHPDLALEIDASPQLVDLQREGFHAGLRVGRGPWPGLESERLFKAPIPFIVVGSPAAARRLLGAQPEMLAREPLLDDAALWERWFAATGLRTKVTTVADFNDAGLLLQAAEQSLGLALCRELLAADALRDGRLVRLSPVSITAEHPHPYHLVYPPSLREWPPLVALRLWLRDELELSQKSLRPPTAQKSRRRLPR
jgi:LysR family glycine cleavage system transcriptional activator